MMCMSWVNTWCPAWALLWVLSSQSSCLSSAPSGHGRGKAELAERLLPLLHFQGAVLGAHTALPKLPGWPLCQLWIASPGSGSLPEIPSAHWPRGAVHLLHQFCAIPKQDGDCPQVFPHKDISVLWGCSGRFPLKAQFEIRPLLVKSHKNFSLDVGQVVFLLATHQLTVI